MNRVDTAAGLHGQGANCAQAVLCAFAGELGLDAETAMRAATGFGGGMGRLAGTCGAVTGAIMAIGLARGMRAPGDQQAKECSLWPRARVRAQVCRAARHPLLQGASWRGHRDAGGHGAGKGGQPLRHALRGLHPRRGRPSSSRCSGSDEARRASPGFRPPALHDHPPVAPLDDDELLRRQPRAQRRLQPCQLSLSQEGAALRQG